MDSDYSPTPFAAFVFALAKKIASEVTIELGQSPETETNGLDEDEIEEKNQLEEDGSRSSTGSIESPAQGRESPPLRDRVVVQADAFEEEQDLYQPE